MEQAKEIKFNGKKLKFHIASDADSSVLNEIFVEKEYRPIEKYIEKANFPVLDIGAHKGFFSVFASTLNQNVSIFAYEPEEENFRALKKHVKTNHCKNVRHKNLAITADGKETTLFISQDSHNHSLVRKTEITKTVGSTTLTNLINKIGRISLAKIDIEGAEYDIFEATVPDILKKIDAFYIEYHKYLPNHNELEIKAKLEKAGFKVQITQSSFDKAMGFILARKNIR